MAAVLPAPNESNSRVSPDRLRRPSPQPLDIKSRDIFEKPALGEAVPEDPSESSSCSESTAPSSPDISETRSSTSASYPPTVSPPSDSPTFPLFAQSFFERNSGWYDNDDVDEIELPSFDPVYFEKAVEAPSQSPAQSPEPQSSPSSNASTIRAPKCDLSIMPRTAGDDSMIETEPTRQVDYLAHEWREEDIRTSWRYIVKRRNVYSNSTRLENASWRSWAKSKYGLGTIPPERLAWKKDCDLTYLYGPLQTSTVHRPRSTSPPPTSVAGTAPLVDKKPILKKRTASQCILQRSLSTHTLLKHAGAIVQAQQADNARRHPGLGTWTSDFEIPRSEVERELLGRAYDTLSSSDIQSPGSGRHISFNDEVGQCIAVDGKDTRSIYGYYGNAEDYNWLDDDLLPGQDVVSMKQTSRRPSLSFGGSTRSSFSSDSKTIALLPSTTLKTFEETETRVLPEPEEPEPEPEIQSPSSSWSFWWPPYLRSPSKAPSTETLRAPSTPQPKNEEHHDNFLLNGEDDDDQTFTMDPSWNTTRREPESVPEYRYDGPSSHRSIELPRAQSPPPPPPPRPSSSPVLLANNFRHEDSEYTSYDMIMDEDEEAMNSSYLGKVYNTVNTARDIAHVIWNIGWRP